jgi:hypothetical protein
MWGDVDALDECASRCTHADMITGVHPLTRHQRVLAGLDRSALFRKGYVRLDVGRASRLVRCFFLVEENHERR